LAQAIWAQDCDFPAVESNQVLVGELIVMSLPLGDVEMDTGKAHMDTDKANIIGIGDEASSHETAPFKVDQRLERADTQAEVKQEGLTETQRKLAMYLALWSTGDIFLSGFISIIAFAHAYRDTGVSLYCLGIQAISHALSSVLLALRFFGEFRLPTQAPAGVKGLLRKRRRRYLVREKYLNTLMGVVMLMSSAALIFKAIRKIKYWNTWYLDHVGLDEDVVTASTFLACYGCALYTIHAVFRGYCGYVMKRAVVWNGFITSVVSLLFLLVIAVAVSFEHEHAWKAEPIAAIILSVVTTSHGGHLIYSHCFDVDERLINDPRA